MGLISPGGENLLDFPELWQARSTFDANLSDPFWWPQDSPVPMRVARGTLEIPPPDVSVHSRETCFPCTASTFKLRIESQHGGTWDSPVGKHRGKASWESLEGKPQIP